MNKIHHDTDQEDLYLACGGVMSQLIADPDGLVKSAASDVFMKEAMEQYKPDKEHFLQHVIAMGDGETYHENANADFWTKQANMERHPTFVSHGSFFREHKNRGMEHSIGMIKASAYNPEMNRIELLVHGNIKKAAEEYEAAKAGKPLSYSMSARVPYDVCNVCGNKAKKVKDYCECLKLRKRQYDPGMKKYAYAINVNPTFFDISRVARPADRIAHYLQYKFNDEGDMKKAASDNAVISGAEWAEYHGVTIPEDYLEDAWKVGGNKARTLEKLAAAEKYVDNLMRTNPREFSMLMHSENYLLGGDEIVKAASQLRPGTLFRMLAKKAAILPLPAFYAYINDTPVSNAVNSPLVKKASTEMEHLFSQVKEEGCCCPDDVASLFDADSSALCEMDPALQNDPVEAFMRQADAQFSARTPEVFKRTAESCVKEASANPVTREQIIADVNKEIAGADISSDQLKLTKHAYALYKIAALTDISEFFKAEELDRIFVQAVLQNYAVNR